MMFESEDTIELRKNGGKKGAAVTNAALTPEEKVQRARAGGIAAAGRMTPKQRSDRARKAAKARIYSKKNSAPE